MNTNPGPPVIGVVYCRHCEAFCLVAGARACDCRKPIHIVCATCADQADPDHLGDLLVEIY